MSALINTSGTLSLKKPKSVEEPTALRYYDKRGRYILQECVQGIWRDVPFVGSLSDVQAVTP